MREEKSQFVAIHFLDNLGNKISPMLILTVTLRKEAEVVAIISTSAYSFAYVLKLVQTFAVSLRNQEFQAEKDVKPETNSKRVVSNKYFDL